MTFDDYITLLVTVADCDVDTLHEAFWGNDIDALAIIAVKYAEVT